MKISEAKPASIFHSVKIFHSGQALFKCCTQLRKSVFLAAVAKIRVNIFPRCLFFKEVTSAGVGMNGNPDKRMIALKKCWSDLGHWVYLSSVDCTPHPPDSPKEKRNWLTYSTTQLIKRNNTKNHHVKRKPICMNIRANENAMAK